MPLTRDFRETVQARAQRDAGFRKALLREALDCMLAGDVDAGKIVLRDYINATVGFDMGSCRQGVGTALEGRLRTDEAAAIGGEVNPALGGHQERRPLGDELGWRGGLDRAGEELPAVLVQAP